MRALFLLLGGLVLSSTLVRAQPFGIAGILNPEGSRLFPQTLVYPRHPGKPDPRWRLFDWKFVDRSVDTPPSKVNYRLFFYKGEEWSARIVTPRIDYHIQSLGEVFSFTPEKKFAYVLFTSLRDFRQANIFFITEGVQGITSTQEATMAIPYWGDIQEFDHVSKHEMVHQFQVQKASRRDMALVPLWFIEGMAEYYSLGGTDEESRVYLRDLLVNPDNERDYSRPKFFDNGPLNFVGVYKAGQAKIDFLETKYGKGTSQKLFTAYLDEVEKNPSTRVFEKTANKVLAQASDQIESSWQRWLENYKEDAHKHKQPLQTLEKVPEISDRIDLFDISPSGKWLAVREINELTGTTSIILMDLSDPQKPRRVAVVAEDNTPSLVSLYFFQVPTLSVGNDWIAYAVETDIGPELEVRQIHSEGEKVTLGKALRARVEKLGFLQISTLALSPDGKNLAFAGLDYKGWSNVYVIEKFEDQLKSDQPPALKSLTSGHYSWQTLSWDEKGILAASNRTPQRKKLIFQIDPKNGNPRQLTSGYANQLYPRREGERFYFQSLESGSPQIHLRPGEGLGTEVQVTDIPTSAQRPVPSGRYLYFIAFQSGRFRLYRTPKNALLSMEVLKTVQSEREEISPPDPWMLSAPDFPHDQVHSYKPFRRDTTRLDDLSIFFSSGGVGGLFASVSDLMRNYSASVGFSVFGSLDQSTVEALFSSQNGRDKWTLGLYRTALPRLDTQFQTDLLLPTFLQKEYGVVGALTHPFTLYSYADFEIRLSGVNRDTYSDPDLEAQWLAVNPGRELLVSPTIRVGYDRIVYEAYTGPLTGYGILGETITSFFIGRRATSQRLRLDFAQYFQLTGRTVLALQAMGGAAFGDRFNDTFFVSSDDMLRAYVYGDRRLFGSYLAATKAELRYPIGALFGFQPLRGLLSYDIGSVFEHKSQFASRIASAYTAGIGLNVPPIAVNLMLSFPQRMAAGPMDDRVYHFTLRYLYL